MTPTGALLIRQFQSEAAAWDDAASDPDADRLGIRTQRAQARRDAIDWALAQLRTALPVIEREAADGADAESERLEKVLGW